MCQDLLVQTDTRGYIRCGGIRNSYHTWYIVYKPYYQHYTEMNDFNDEVHQSIKQVPNKGASWGKWSDSSSKHSRGDFERILGILKGSRHVTRGGGSRAPVHVTTLPVLDWHNGSRDTSVTRDWELVGILKGFWGFWKNSALAKWWPSAARRRMEAVLWRLASIPRTLLCENVQKNRFFQKNK